MTDWIKSQPYIIKKISLSSAMAIFGIIYASPVYAYLDPGTGSIILQGLIAGFLAIAAAGSLFWQRIKSFFAKLSFSEKSDKTDQSKDAD